MSPGSPPTSRSSLLDEILARLGGRGPRVTLLSGARGWGKAELLDNVTRRLAGAGIHPVEIDVSRSAIHPGEFACELASRCLETALGASASGAAAVPGLPSPEGRLRALANGGRVGTLGPGAAGCVEEIFRCLDSPRSPGREMVKAALELPGRLAGAAGGPVVLVARGLDQISRLAPFPGLRGVAPMVAAALRPASLRLAASISPEGRPVELLAALRENLGREMDEVVVPPLDLRQARSLWGGGGGLKEGMEALLQVTGGRLLSTRILAEALSRGRDLAEVLFAEMEPGSGRLYLELRFDYHLLIERTRGHAACRAALNVLAREEGLDLSGVAGRLRRSPGSTLDYLRWLQEVGLVRREGRRYAFTDPLLRLHVLLDQVPEHPVDAPGRASVIRGFLSGLESPRVALRPLGRPRGSRKPVRTRPAPEPPSPPVGGPPDELMEID